MIIVYEAYDDDLYSLEQAALNFELELLITQLFLEYDEAREKHGDDVSLMLHPDTATKLMQKAGITQKHCFYNEKLKSVK